MKTNGSGTWDKPWKLKTPPGTKNPVLGWDGLKKGLRGRFGMYMPPLLEALGLADTHDAKNNKMRAK